MFIIIFSNKYKNNLLSKINEYVIFNYKKLDKKDFELGDIPYNFRCHLNAVQKVKKGEAEEVYLCIAIDTEDTEPVIHFINKKGDNFIDNTWGWLYEDYDYYLIRKINPVEYNNIGGILDNTRAALLNLFSKKWIRQIFLKNDLII